MSGPRRSSKSSAHCLRPRATPTKEAKTIAFLEQMFTKSGRGTQNMVDFFDDNSHGSVDTGESKVFGWLTLPKKWSDYKGSGANPQGRQDLMTWARQAAATAGIDLTPFFNLVICMNASSTQGTDERRVGKECRSRWSPYH